MLADFYFERTGKKAKVRWDYDKGEPVGDFPFMEAVKELLCHMDFDISQLHTESFGSGRVAQGITKEAGSLKLSGPLHRVTFSKSGLTVDTDENITLLELAEANGVEIAYSCRSGSCGECEAKCQGDVGIRGECFIDEKAKATGFVYTCSTVAKADLVLEA